MRSHSPLWLLSAALLATGAALQGAATWLYWQPCPSPWLEGSLIRGFTYTLGTEACAVAMDQHTGFVLPTPAAGWTTMGSLGAASAVVLALAWLVVLPALRTRVYVTLLASLPGIVAIWAAIASTLASLDPMAGPEAWPGDLFYLLDVVTVVALVALCTSGVTGRHLTRAAIVLVAATSPGRLHQVADYFVSCMVSDANWDSPPGTGFLTVFWCFLSAIATAVLWWRSGHWARSSAPSSTVVDSGPTHGHPATTAG